nr:spike protein [Alphacoronavirus sp.]
MVGFSLEKLALFSTRTEMKIFTIICLLAFLGCCNCNCNTPTVGMKIQLGLPVSTTAYVSGYLPVPNNWTCVAGTLSKLVGKARGVFLRYVHSARGMSFGVGSHDNAGLQGDYPLYSLFVWQRNGHSLIVRICRWWLNKDLSHNKPGPTSSGACLLNKEFPNLNFVHDGYQVVGVSWTGDTVTVHGRYEVYNLIVPGAALWDTAVFACEHKDSCGHQLISDMITINATTNQVGTITNYSLCNTCNGFPQHVFAVADGGKIPPTFDFTNWFFLTNSTSPIQGRVVSRQPLHLQCLWPIPALSSDTGVIYFNQSRNVGTRCNGFSNNSVFSDHLRFALNTTSSGSVLFGSLSFFSGTTVYNFTCSNSTTNFTKAGIPFGVTDKPYYCFVTQGFDVAANRTFAGIMPIDLREIVVSRWGSIYLNGFKLFSLPYIDGVIFNFTSFTGSDFWTVAYSSEVEVLLDLQNTYMTNILYCDSPLNRLKCQQKKFYLEDGFYSSTELEEPVVNSVVLLPEYSGYTNVTVLVEANYTQELTLDCEPKYGEKRITLVNSKGEQYPNNTVCVNTNRVSLNFVYQLSHRITCDISARTDKCSFSPSQFNNYLKFGSLCFSLHDNGGCEVPITSYSYQFQTVRNFGATLYVLSSPGDSITSVPPSFSDRLGFLDSSVLHLNVCTSYNIYGIAGKGVIVESNATYHTGIYYTDASGALASFKNTTTGQVYEVRPCQTPKQYAVVNDAIVGVIAASPAQIPGLDFNHTRATPMFYYLSNSPLNCSNPSLTYATMGICADGSIGEVQPRTVSTPPMSPIITGNVTVPVNFTVSVQAEYVQVSLRSVVVDCATYVCNGNVRCLQLLRQYVTACTSVENALALNARLESQEVADMLVVDEAAYSAAVKYQTEQFTHDFNITNVMPAGDGKGSFVEDLLFDKVITNGLGTVDADYKACLEEKGYSADIICRQYYNGISVLPTLTDDGRMGFYSASLMGGIVLGAFGLGAPALPFSLAVFSKLNYLALQTDFIQENQKHIANAFNNAMGNITAAFTNVDQALQHTSDAIKTVADALNKVQSAVNTQGQALEKLTSQLAINFDAISASIEDIYNRLDELAADAQVDRLINGRLAALSTFVSSQLVQYSEVRASRKLALQKVNECVRSQSNRLGFCGNGTHLFSLVSGAPEGLMFFHTVLLPTEFREVQAWAGLCISDKAFVLREPGQVLFQLNGKYYITPRNMYQPRDPTTADFVQIQSCAITYLNLTSDEFGAIVPDYIDVNKTLEDFASKLPNYTTPDFSLDKYNHTFLNITAQIELLENKSRELTLISERLQQNIDNINSTLLDLEWLDKVETYIKWPWWVWLIFAIVFVVLAFLMLWCCLATGCCGCCSCLATSCSSFCDCRGKKLQRYDVEKIHIQ